MNNMINNGKFNGFEIYVSQMTGNDLNSGSFGAPLATLNAALTLAGSPSPSAPVIINIMDGATYDEQLNFAPSTENLFFFGPAAQINFSGVGDTVTIGLNCKIFFQMAGITNSGTGTAITNNGGELFGYIDILQSAGTVINHVGPAGACLITSSIALEGDILLAGGGNVLYNTQIRSGTDAAGVVGINITGTSGSWTALSDITSTSGNISASSGFLYAQGDVTSNSGNVVSNTGYVQALAGNLIAGTNGALGQVQAYPASSNTGYMLILPNANLANVTTSISNQPTSVGTSHALPNVAFANVTLLPCKLTQVDPMSNLIYFDTTVTFTQLSGGASVPLVSTFFGGQYRVRELFLNYNSLNLLGGDRDLNITDGTTIYSTIPSASLITSLNSRWGSASVPFPSSVALDTITQPGVNLFAVYSGGTIDYLSGEVIISGCWEKVV